MTIDALEVLEKQAASWPVPGLQVSIVQGGEVVFAGGFGECDSATLMRHGSCAKGYTGLLATLLADEGLIDLDAPVREYVPELRTADPYVTDRITIRDLLAHRSSLGRHDFVWILHPDWTVDELLRRLPHLPLHGELRAGMVYCNLGYALAGLAMGRAAGASWARLIEKRILEPLGMSRTYVQSEGIDPGQVKAQPYVMDGDRPVPTRWRSLEGVAPAGELLSCAPDAARWLLLQAGAGAGIAGEAMSSAARATHRLHTPVPPEMSPWPELRLYGYGLGWLVASYRGRPAVSHAGGIDGFLTETFVLPEDGIGVTVSANVHMSELPLAACLSIADELLEEADRPDWYDRRREHPSPSAVAADQAGEAHPPTQSLEAFAGVYRHPGYGDLVVGVEGDSLSVGLGAGSFEVAHRHFDTWALNYRPLDAQLPLTFITAADGVPSEAVIPLDPSVPGIRFTRDKDS